MAKDPERGSATGGNSPANLPRRVYKTASVAGVGPPYPIHLDSKPVRTPQKSILAVPSRALAEAVAAEWEAQGPAIDPRTMPLTKLANSAIDRVGASRRRAIGEILKFTGSDLVCYRATEPVELARRQANVWDAIVGWARDYLAVEFRVVGGIVFADQPPGALAAVQMHLEGRSDWELAAIHATTTLTGSGIVAMMLEREAIGGERAWSAVHLDEDWQIEHWGEDAEAQAGRAARRRDFDAAVRFLELLKYSPGSLG